MEPKFPLGRVVMTANCKRTIDRALGLPADQPMVERICFIDCILELHQAGVWGDVCDEDRQSNDDALRLGNRILSVYRMPWSADERVWIITERDRSTTTILLPEDY